MSLGRLLSAGKALTNLRDEASAYQMRRKALLPKFCGGGAPFASVKEPSPLASGDAAAVRPGDQPGRRSSIWPWKWPGKNGQATTNTRPRPAHELRRVNVPGITPVQAELSLSNVKVVRNDLNGSDVDLVARGGGSANLYFGDMTAGKAERALDRLADRIVGVQPR